MRILVLTVVTIVGVWVAGTYLISLSNDARVSAVIGEIHTLQTAQVDFYSRHGRYAESMAELAPELDGGVTDGYRFRVTANGNSYLIEARPVRGHGQIFLSDESLTVKSVRND
jgi:hypothetical protein